MDSFSVLFAYFTPETTLPVASAIAAVLGFGLLVIRAPIRVVKEGLRRAVGWVRTVGKKSDP
jgi:hypothetical protein